MRQKLPFVKMQGAGNDYIYINCFVENVPEPGPLARRMSDRHFGVGSDGLVLVMPSDCADVRMRMFNSDGSEAEMCGNASRCVAKFAYDRGLVSKDHFTLETGAGPRPVKLEFAGSEVVGATVDMGEPVLEPELIPARFQGHSGKIISEQIEVAGNDYAVTAVSMGNPHAVYFIDGIDRLDLPVIGPAFENHPWFPKKTNSEFVEVLGRDRIRMRVWERGAGETLACGTGACAAAVASILNGLTGRSVEVELRGGSLYITWDEKSNHIFMKGPAVTVFEGEYLLPQQKDEA